VFIVDHHCLNLHCFVDIGGIVDHHCLNLHCFVDIGGIGWSTIPPISTKQCKFKQ
jgi:hypothetical protein